MGALLSRMAPVELRIEEGARAEPYNMLLESQATVRSQRALKRELCFTRAAVLVLVLALGVCLCLMFFMQPFVCKDSGHDGKANGDQNHPPLKQNAANDADPKQSRSACVTGNQGDQQRSDPKQPHSISLGVNCSAISATNTDNVTWNSESQNLDGFTLQDDKSLVVPELAKYRISLHVTYRNPDSFKGELIVLFHRVVVYHKGYPKPRPLMDVFETANWKNQQKTWFKTKYSEHVIRLDKGDIIRVEASNPNFIYCPASSLSVRYESAG